MFFFVSHERKSDRHLFLFLATLTWFSFFSRFAFHNNECTTVCKNVLFLAKNAKMWPAKYNLNFKIFLSLFSVFRGGGAFPGSYLGLVDSYDTRRTKTRCRYSYNIPPHTHTHNSICFY